VLLFSRWIPEYDAQIHEFDVLLLLIEKESGPTKADMSRIFNHRITRFTDKLIRLYSKINPGYQLKVA
jgi:hypothetical protein